MGYETGRFRDIFRDGSLVEIISVAALSFLASVRAIAALGVSAVPCVAVCENSGRVSVLSEVLAGGFVLAGVALWWD